MKSITIFTINILSKMTTYIFNQYFLTFIKTVKKNAKPLKEKKAIARDTLNKIHAFYNTFHNELHAVYISDCTYYSNIDCV